MKRLFKIKKKMACVYIFLGLLHFWGFELMNFTMHAFYPYTTVFAIITAIVALFEKIHFNEKFILCVIRGGIIVTLSTNFFCLIALMIIARNGIGFM